MMMMLPVIPMMIIIMMIDEDSLYLNNLMIISMMMVWPLKRVKNYYNRDVSDEKDGEMTLSIMMPVMKRIRK